MSDIANGTYPDFIETISPNDWMFKGNPVAENYFRAGWSVGRVLKAATDIVEAKPARILDFGCGHGRVLRWLKAVYPDAEIVAADRVRGGVDFCRDTFGATPVYSVDAFDQLNLGGDFDLIWLGSVYTHLPLSLWTKLTDILKSNLSPNGLLAFSFAGPHVAKLIMAGERNASAEVTPGEFDKFLSDYQTTGSSYARHEGVGDREWGRSLISHSRLFDFLHLSGLSITLLGEQLYDNRQDIVVCKPTR